MKSLVSLVAALGLVLVSCSGVPKTGTPGSPSLTSVVVAPAAMSVNTGASQPFSATGRFSDGTTKDLTATAQWSSSNTSVASIDATGLANGVAPGTATITAKSATVQGTATLTVTNAGVNLTGILISPQISSIPVNTTQQLSATGSYSDGSNRDLTSLVSWSSSSSAAATVDANGVVTAVAAGSATITAGLNNVTGSITIAVTTPTISAISVTPVGLTLPIGINQQYIVTADYSDGTSADLSSGVVWSSSTTAVASVDNTGVATTLSAGTTSITATVGGLTDSSTLTVVAAHLQSISVSPATSTIAVGTALQFTATGSFDDGSTQILTPLTWSSSAQNIVSVNSLGLATAAIAGTATITASSGGISGTASVTVTNATLASLAISPANSNMPIGATKQFTATGTFSDSSTQDVTLSVLWSSSSAATATINSKGLVSSVAAGTTAISATLGSVTGSTSLTVSNVKLVSIVVNPASAQIAAGTALKFSATGTFSDGSTATNLTGLSWKSSKPQFASIRSSGVAHGKRVGTVTITATSSGITGTATLVVGNGTLVSIAISPINPSIAVGGTQQFAAIGTFSDATTQDVTLNTHWSSSSSSVATIANGPNLAGLASTTGIGVTTIGANSGGIQTSTSLSAH